MLPTSLQINHIKTPMCGGESRTQIDLHVSTLQQMELATTKRRQEENAVSAMTPK
jgi:hypothetical protein